MSAASALQAALFTHLAADTALSALIGTDAIHDRVMPANTPRPYVQIASIDSRDISGDGAPLEEHDIRLLVIGAEGGHRPVQLVAARLKARLEDAALKPAGFRLSSMSCQEIRIRQDPVRAGHNAELRLRAVTEPA
ncbi:hypothetical protein BJF93_19400 [Xaviernesmea oryzae]|uniref:DUF3168 domain-containing protein n=1 Tax=Xaviernesmea oryzae TaxID=464029 RepID=A0A1Q9B1G6_9HYPH|nr:DUF3168 domain-containing protein [Xaviernesmea oryzae]OLP61853.1 hypothetical protein BJF93_19400 [Xaviernesmea oryzae]SEL75348.1 Protein of unknown function [Xaviernesmea oryzae]